MAGKKPRKSKTRPFPWPCPNCFTQTVVPTVIDFTTKVKQDGVIHELHLPQVEVPRCQTCGELIITSEVDELVNDALRSKLHLLTPTQIRRGIEALGLKQQEVAEKLGVAPETISRWVTGALIQSRAMDNLMRLFFALPQVRNVLRGADQDPELGTNVHPEQGETASHSVNADCPEPIVRRLRANLFQHANETYGEDNIRSIVIRVREEGWMPMGQN